MPRKIIFVTGPPGSGKTTLSESLKQHPNVVSIDLDDIGDLVYQKIRIMKSKTINTKKKRKKKQFDIDEWVQWREKEEKMYDNILASFVNGNKDKHLVIVGLASSRQAYGKRPIDLADIKFYITIDFKTCYRRFLKRILEDLVSKKDEIHSLLDEADVESISDDMHHFFGVRMPFPVSFQDYSFLAANTLSDAMRQEFVPIASDFIYEAIVKEIREDVSL